MTRDLRTARVVNELLKVIVITSMVGGAMIAPNTVQLGNKALRFLDKRSRKQETDRVMAYMRRKRLIDYRELQDRSLEIRVTDKGRKREHQVRFEELAINKMKKWDKKWRLVMFDIPESRKRSRRALSLKLRQLNFYQLQKSVWVQAYPCKAEVEIVKAVFGIPDRDIIMAEISKTEQENRLLKHFNLVT